MASESLSCFGSSGVQPGWAWAGETLWFKVHRHFLSSPTSLLEPKLLEVRQELS